MKRLLVCLAAAATPLVAAAHECKIDERKTATRVAFARAYPCPATGRPSPYHCTGYFIEHAIPLACGGPDAVWNLYWADAETHRIRTRLERRGPWCECNHTHRAPEAPPDAAAAE